MVFNAVVLANALRPKVRFAAIIGSYGWAGKMADMVKAAMPNLKVELLPSVIAKGLPKPADLEAIDALAAAIAAKHQELGLDLGAGPAALQKIDDLDAPRGQGIAADRLQRDPAPAAARLEAGVRSSCSGKRGASPRSGCKRGGPSSDGGCP